MIYIWDLEKGKQLYVENQGTQTVITIITSRSGERQVQRRTFEIGVWRVPPLLLRTATDLVLQIESARGHIFMRIQDNDISPLRTLPLLIGAEVLPHQQVAGKERNGQMSKSANEQIGSSVRVLRNTQYASPFASLKGKLITFHVSRFTHHIKESTTMIRTRFVYALLIGILFTVQAGFAEDYALIIGGVGGEKSFYDEFWRATSRMHDLLTKEYGNSPKNITFLFEDEGGTSGRVNDKATKANVEQAFADMAQKVKPTDRFILFMIGHATRAGGGLKFNLPGPDVSDTEYADFINRIPAQQVILVFGFPYGANMVPLVSKNGRTIITSCSPREGYMRSGFGNIFVDAFSDAAADTDGDGAISLLEAFLYTQKKVKEWYEKDGSV
ncbi:caspase family protein, partial [Candidatus Poribacteria bacterium]|nr:caspase family protein [Candidatus Poribacteria bacterium]